MQTTWPNITLLQRPGPNTAAADKGAIALLIHSGHPGRALLSSDLSPRLRMGKFDVLNESKEWVAHGYGDVFFKQPMSSGERLIIGPSNDHIAAPLI